MIQQRFARAPPPESPPESPRKRYPISFSVWGTTPGSALQFPNVPKNSGTHLWRKRMSSVISPVCIGIGLIGSLGMATRSLADLPPNYNLIDVAAVNGCFDQVASDFGIAYGINEAVTRTVGQAENACVGGIPARAFRRNLSNSVMIDLGTLGGEFAAAFAVRDSAHSVGWAFTFSRPNQWPRPVIFGSGVGGMLTNLPTIGGFVADEGVAYDIDTTFRIVGQSETAEPGEFHATFWEQTSPASGVWVATDLGELTADTDSLARGKNETNDIVGWGEDSMGVQKAVIWEPSGPGTWTMTALPSLSASGNSMAHEINDSKVICGWSVTSAPERHAVRWEFVLGSWVITDLGTLPGGNKSEAFAINNDGDIIGQSRIAAGPGNERSFLWSGGTMFDLNERFCRYNTNTSANWVLHEALDFTNSGAICGWGLRDAETEPRPFVLKPISCVGDVNGDGVTDVADLLLLLAAWAGPCGPADLDNGGVVGVGDLLLLLADWGCNDPESEPFPESYGDCLDRFPNDPEAAAACIEALIKIGA